MDQLRIIPKEPSHVQTMCSQSGRQAGARVTDGSAGRSFGTIQDQPGPASSADQPDSISHVGDVVSRRYVGLVEVPSAPRANRLGPTGESRPDVFDFMGFELFCHGNENSRVCIDTSVRRKFRLGRSLTLLTALARSQGLWRRPDLVRPACPLNTVAGRRVFPIR